MTDRRQAGVWSAETKLARATKARARVDFLKNMLTELVETNELTRVGLIRTESRSESVSLESSIGWSKDRGVQKSDRVRRKGVRA